MKKRAVLITRMDAQPEQHKFFLDWMTERIKLDGEFKPDDAIAFAHVEYDDDLKAEILGVVAVNNWSPSGCEGHIASDGTGRFATRRFGFTVYDFVFRHANKTRFNFFVRVENAPAISMHDRLGHERMCRLPDFYGEDQDAFMYGLTRNQWRAGKYATEKVQ